jgi:hypothetical protein
VCVNAGLADESTHAEGIVIVNGQDGDHILISIRSRINFTGRREVFT